MQSINWAPIISIVFWITIAYLAYAIYKQLDKIGAISPLKQAYWLTRQRLWELNTDTGEPIWEKYNRLRKEVTDEALDTLKEEEEKDE